jgi:hypothetical protein
MAVCPDRNPPGRDGAFDGGVLKGKRGEPIKGYGLQLYHPRSPGVSIRIHERGIVMKAVALLSGGLDSTLAAKVILEQGIELSSELLTVSATVRTAGNL